MLTPESLQYGTGTYYIMAVVNKSTEAMQCTPILVSVVTAVTQCYFWDQNNRTWKSDGCQVRGGVAGVGVGGLSETLAAPLPLPSLGIGQKQQHSEGKQIFQGTERRLACGSRAGVSLERQVRAVFFQFPSQCSGRPV